MKVRGIKHVEIDIDKYEQKEIVEKFLMELFDIPSSQCYIEKGNLIMWWEDGGGTHSWTDKKSIRKATESDKLYFDFIDKLNELWNSNNTIED